jgi:hypothetical protein
MKRRELIVLLSCAETAWALAAYAQSAARKVQRIGIIDDSPNWDAFRQQLRELNYVEGQNLRRNAPSHGAVGVTISRRRYRLAGIRHTVASNPCFYGTGGE